VYRLEWAKGYPIAFEEWEKDAIPQLKVDALDRLVAKDQRHRSRACRPSSYAPSFILPSGPMILCSRTWWEGASSLSTRRLHDLVPNCELFTSDN